MTQTGTSRARTIALALATALAALLGLYRWIGTGASPPTLRFAAPVLPAAATRESVHPGVTPASRFAPPRDMSAPPRALPTEPSSKVRSTPSVFDLATIARPGETSEHEEERFRTNEWFTDDDLQHPEIYFSRAERVPELNRPEERRDVLAFFVAYREKLGRDLEGVGDKPNKREQILAAIERYDGAIARLRKIVDGEGAK